MWTEDLFETLARRPICGYGSEQAAAVEPTALTAMALAASGRESEAQTAARFLASLQSANGSVGVRPGLSKPAWTTSLAMLAWLSLNGGAEFQSQLAAATTWTLETRGLAVTDDADLGHDTSLIGWSWAEKTHSWIEPTILHVLSLKAVGLRDDERVREAIRLLIDRQLPDGGCNYGNTSVMGQWLRPHLQPSGMLLLALADEQDASGRLSKTVAYVATGLEECVTTASWCWAALGLCAVGRTPDELESRVRQVFDRAVARGKGPLPMALVAHAALGSRSPLCVLPGRGTDR